MRSLKTYVVHYNYQGCFRGHWWTQEKEHTVQATTKKEARKLFDEWHEHHGEIRDYHHHLPVRRHPFNVTITQEDAQ